MPLPENSLIKPLLDEPPRTAYRREGTEETAVSMSGMGRRHLGAIIMFCRRRAQGSMMVNAVLFSHRLVVLHTAPSGAFRTRIPDLQATIIQSQCLEVVLDSLTRATTHLHHLHPANVTFSCDRP